MWRRRLAVDALDPARRPLRVGLVHCLYQQRGGEDVMVAAQERLLRQHGHHVRTAYVHNSALGSSLASAAQGLARRGRDAIQALGRAEELDLLHIHNAHPSIGPSIYGWAEANRVPTVTTLHNYRWFCVAATLFRDGRPCTDCMDARTRLPGVVHRCFRGSAVGSALVAGDAWRTVRHVLGWAGHHVIVLTEFQREMVVNRGIPRDRVHVVRDFVEDRGSHVLPVGAGTLALPGRFALFVGRLVPEKGIVALAAAWAARSPRTPLLIVGNGPQRPEVERIAAASTSVRYLGPLSDGDLLVVRSTARVLVVPSEGHEPTGLVILESLARGRPAVVPDSQPLPEVIAGSQGGVVVPAHDLSAMVDAADGIAQAADDRWAASARALFEERYSVKAHAAGLEKTYYAILSEAP